MHRAPSIRNLDILIDDIGLGDLLYPFCRRTTGVPLYNYSNVQLRPFPYCWRFSPNTSHKPNHVDYQTAKSHHPPSTMPDSQQASKSITCHCKAIRITFPPLREPALECLCSICRRYGALWAYYKPEEVQVEGDDAVEAYVWGKKRLSFNRCKHCGCMTHYTVVRDTEPRVAVSCRMLERVEFDELESAQSDGE